MDQLKNTELKICEHLQNSQGFSIADSDFWTFGRGYNLDPRGAIQAAQLLKYAYRDSLRNVLIVDAPLALNAFWMLVKPTLPQGTQRKVGRETPSEALIQGYPRYLNNSVNGKLEHVARQCGA